MGGVKRLSVVVLMLAALPGLGLAAEGAAGIRAQAVSGEAAASIPDALLVLAPDPRPWNEKVAPGLLAAALERRGEVECLVTLRSPEVLADFRQVSFDNRDRLRWIARSGDELDRDLRPAGVTVLTRYSHLPILHVRVPADALPTLAGDRRVEAVSPNRVARATRADGKTLMRVAQLAAAGYTGAGVTVAVLDTGVDYNHTELSPGGSDTTAKTIKGADVIDGDGDPMDGEGHGTAVAGIIAGTSGGVAPAARIYAVRILDNEGNGSGSQILAGINDVVSRVSGGNPLNIKVANLSLGGYFGDGADGVPPQPCDADVPEFAGPLNTLIAAGVLPVASAGNGGCTTGVAWPACISSTLAVGAVYDANIGSASFSEDQCIPTGCTDSTTAADTIACFSDSGAELDVWAPSFCATTTARGGGYDSCFGGTSASAPYASGVAALLTHAVPARGATALHSAMTNSGVDLTDTRNGITRKSVRADLALTALQSGCTAPAVPTGLALSQGSACSGEQFTLSWNAVSGAASYTLQMATDANFTSLVSLSPSTFTGTSVNLTVNGAYVGPLYLRVRANASCGASSQYSGSVQLQFTGSNCSSYTNTYYLSGVAHTPGVAPAFWYSDTAILNAGTSSVDLRISFNGVNSTPTPVLVTLGAHKQVTWTDVLLQAFGSTTNDAGVIVVEATGPVIVLGRTYAKTTPTALSYGSAYPGMQANEALSAGQVGYLSGLRSDGNFRTNVEAVNVGTADATVEFRFFNNAGSQIGTTTLAAIAPGKRASQTRALPSGQSAAFAEVRVTPTGATVLAFATVMDADANATDPTTIELHVP